MKLNLYFASRKYYYLQHLRGRKKYIMKIETNEKDSFVLKLLKVFEGELIDCCYEICAWCEENRYDFEEQADCLQEFFECYEKTKNLLTKNKDLFDILQKNKKNF